MGPHPPRQRGGAGRGLLRAAAVYGFVSHTHAHACAHQKQEQGLLWSWRGGVGQAQASQSPSSIVSGVEGGAARAQRPLPPPTQLPRPHILLDLTCLFVVRDMPRLKDQS